MAEDQDKSMQDGGEYDVIIVGGGTAGSVLAYRLTAHPALSVLVLEAGEDRNADPNIYTPALGYAIQSNEDYGWTLSTEPEPGLNGRKIAHPRGKLLGGSSAINSYALLYPHRASIDVWEEMGCKGWNWKTLEPYFAKFQTIAEPAPEVRERLSPAHTKETTSHTNGPLQSSFPARVQPLDKVWVEAWRNLGLENEKEALQGEAIGGHTSSCHISASTKERSHAGAAFLASVALRSNLTIITGALVDKVEFTKNGEKQTATAVLYEKGVKSFRVSAKRKIVLSAGTFLTPALLERSGIGSSPHLSSLSIPTIQHNPAVGQNLQDHIRGGISFEANDNIPPSILISREEAQKMYERDRSGPFGEMACFEFAYMPLLPFLSSEEKGGLQRVVNGTKQDPGAGEFGARHLQFIQSILSDPQQAVATAFLSRRRAVAAPPDEVPKSWITLYAMLGYPLSTGSVHISTTDAGEKPRIKCNYYANDVDLEVHALVLKALHKLAATPPLRECIKWDGKRIPDIEPSAPLGEWKEYLRECASTNYHPCGSCSMGPEASGGVVDENLNVHGVEGLSIVDASILPIIPRCNIISTVYAVAERGADLLLEEMGYQVD